MTKFPQNYNGEKKKVTVLKAITQLKITKPKSWDQVPAIALKSDMKYDRSPISKVHSLSVWKNGDNSSTCSAYLRVILRIKSDKVHRSPWKIGRPIQI